MEDIKPIDKFTLDKYVKEEDDLLEYVKKRALEELVIDGIETNRDFLFEIIKNPNFIREKFDTSFIEKEMFKGDK